MPSTLPSTIGFGHSSSGSIQPQASSHAQNFSTSKLNQHKERVASTTSMGRVMQQKQYGSNSGPSSSIARVMQGDRSEKDDQYAVYSEEDREEIRTRLRYKNIRRIMKEKKDAAAAAEKVTKQKTGFHIKTGKTYSKEGYGGTKKTLRKLYHEGRHSKLKNLSTSDRKHLEEIVEEGGAHGSVGGSYSYSTKKKMGQKAWKKYKKGEISKQDYKDFKGVIRDLD
jgi:hypothetical protein